MSKKARYPYQPSIPKKAESTLAPTSLGYPPPKPAWYSNLKTVKEKQEAVAILKELGIENDAVAFVKLLEDEERLKAVVKKLKLKAFW